MSGAENLVGGFVSFCILLSLSLAIAIALALALSLSLLLSLLLIIIIIIFIRGTCITRGSFQKGTAMYHVFCTKSGNENICTNKSKPIQ